VHSKACSDQSLARGKTPSDPLPTVTRLFPQSPLYNFEALSDQQHREFLRELQKSSIPGKEVQQGFRSQEVLFFVIFFFPRTARQIINLMVFTALCALVLWAPLFRLIDTKYMVDCVYSHPGPIAGSLIPS
jgi:hypothetical protein